MLHGEATSLVKMFDRHAPGVFMSPRIGVVPVQIPGIGADDELRCLRDVMCKVDETCGKLLEQATCS